MLPKTFPQGYPQKPWKAYLLPFAFRRCSQEGESMSPRCGCNGFVRWRAERGQGSKAEMISKAASMMFPTLRRDLEPPLPRRDRIEPSKLRPKPGWGDDWPFPFLPVGKIVAKAQGKSSAATRRGGDAHQGRQVPDIRSVERGLQTLDHRLLHSCPLSSVKLPRRYKIPKFFRDLPLQGKSFVYLQ